MNKTEEERKPGQPAADYFVYLCISRTDFADQVFSSIKIEGRILAVVIIFPIALVFVIFLTYGYENSLSLNFYRLSYEVAN